MSKLSENLPDYVFVTGMGRSGTSFLSKLLALNNEVDSQHEFIGNREFWLLSWYLENQNYTIPFLEKEKLRIDERQNSTSTFIDSNSYLQLVPQELTKVFPNSKVFHLIRDPKKVISSIYTRRDDQQVHMLPKDQENLNKWMSEDRFYQVCWNWKNTMEKLIASKTELLHFEKIIDDFDYLSDQLLTPCGLDISQKNWETIKNQKVNKTKGQLYRRLYAKIKGKQFHSKRLGDFSSWPEKYQKTFKELCVPLSKELGY